MSPQFHAPLFALGLFAGMLLMLEIGWRVGRRNLRLNPERVGTGSDVLDAAVFALFGLLIAFTFSGAASRFDARKHLVAREANDIGTAYLRLDLLRPDAQPALRELFRNYLDSRLDTYRKLPDVQAAEAEFAHSQQLQREIWSLAVAASDAKGDPATTTLIISALNSMFDITTTRAMAARVHPPFIVFALLFVLALACSLLAGHNMSANKTRSWLNIFGFMVILVLSIYVILDMEYPRIGWIRVDAEDRVLIDLRRSMG